MQCFSRVAVCTFGLISALSFVQACKKESKKKYTPSSSAQSAVIVRAWAHAINSENASESTIALWPSCASSSISYENQKCKLVKNSSDQVACELLQDINSGGLTLEKATHIALANNPELYISYDNLELGYVELIEASLRQNPRIVQARRYPDEADKKVDKLFDSTVSLLDDFLIPLRQRAAQAEINVIEAQVGQKVLDLVKEVQLNWLSVKALELQIDKENLRVELKSIAADLAALQHKAGNVNLLSAQMRDKYQDAREKIKNLIAELEMAREKLNRSLGLFGNDACWKISGDIEWETDPPLLEINYLERAAIENRPDLEAIRREIFTLAQKARLKEPWTYTNLRIGVSSEREPDGMTVTGPLIDLEWPVYNYGQGEIRKYNILIAQAQKKLLAKAIQACSEVRELVKTAQIYKSQLENYEKEILPDHIKYLAEGKSLYNVMALGAYALFDLKDEEAQAFIEQILALKNYTKAKIELLHAVGGSFDILGRKE